MALENEEEEYYDESRFLSAKFAQIGERHSLDKLKEGYKELGNQWLVNKLYGGERPEWFTSNRGVDSHGFTPGMKS
ncbi:hypothetical protein KY289_026923 [Solanum tuberosum]|nr:hypothetical protein KY289_026923 [Solanum tuberosum]